MPDSLTGKVAFVTGGSRGIGKAIVRRLATEGALVVFTYRSTASAAIELSRTIGASHGITTPVQADSADPVALRAAIRDTAATHGRLDILVNNAGLGHFGALGSITIDDFERLLAVNLGAVFHASQEAAAHLSDGGRIITIGSINADRNPFPGNSIYAMTKAGAAGFTSALARELGPRAITVNTVQPGPVDTDLNPADGPFADVLRRYIALGRFGTADEIAALVAFLAGPDAGYITGATLDIDGGLAA